MLEVPAGRVEPVSSESTWTPTRLDTVPPMVGQLNGLEGEERRYTAEEKGKGKAPQPLTDMTEHNFTSNSADHSITEPCSVTKTSSKRRGRPPKAKPDEPNDEKKVKGRGKAKEGTDANSSGSRIKWKVVNHKVENRPHASGDKHSIGRGSDESVELRPRVWSSSKVELLSAFPSLSGKTCVNGISWSQTPVPIVLLDGGNGMAISAMEDDKEIIMEMTITRDFECLTTDMCDPDGRPLSLPSIPPDILSSLLQSDPQHAPAPRRVTRQGNQGEASITMSKGKDRAVTKARNVNAPPCKNTDTNKPVPIDVLASKHTSLPTDITSERVVSSTEPSRARLQNSKQLSADPFQGVKDEGGAMPKDTVRSTKSLRPRDKLSGSAAYSDAPLKTSNSTSSGISRVSCEQSDKASTKANQGRVKERLTIIIPPRNALGRPKEGDNSGKISAQSVKTEPASPHLSAIDGAPTRTSSRLHKRNLSTAIPKSDTKKRKLRSRTDDSASASTVPRRRRPRLPSTRTPRIQTSDTHEIPTEPTVELAITTHEVVEHTSALLSVDSTFDKSKPLMSPGSPLTPLSPDALTPPPSPKRRRIKGLPPTRHSARISAVTTGNTVVKLEHEESLVPSSHWNTTTPKGVKRKRPGHDVGYPRLPAAPTGNAGRKRPSTLARNQRGVVPKVENESVSVACREPVANNNNSKREVLRKLKFQKTKSPISPSMSGYDSQKSGTAQSNQVLDHEHNNPPSPSESTDVPRRDPMDINTARSSVQDLHEHDTSSNVESTFELVKGAKERKKVLQKLKFRKKDRSVDDSAPLLQANKSTRYERELPSLQGSVDLGKDSFDAEALSMELPTPLTDGHAHDVGPCPSLGLAAPSIGQSSLSMYKVIPGAPPTIPVSDYAPEDGGIYEPQIAFQNYERNNPAVASVCVVPGHQSSLGDMAASSVSLPIVETLNYKQELCDMDFSAIRSRGDEAQTLTQIPAMPDNLGAAQKVSSPFISLSPQVEHISPDKPMVGNIQCAASKLGDELAVYIPHSQISSDIRTATQSSPLAVVSTVVMQDGGSHSSLLIDPPALLPGPTVSTTNLAEVAPVVQSKAVSQEFEDMKSQLRVSFPVGVPEEVKFLDNALKNRTLILPITTREIFGLHGKSWLPKEFAYLFLGFWQVIGIQRSRVGLEENSKLSLGSTHQPCRFAGRVRWSVRLCWVAGGEDNLGHKGRLDAPWWSPSWVSMSVIDSSMRRLSLSEAENDGSVAESFSLPCLISSLLGFGNGDGGFVKGWYCSDCGKLNRQTFWRRQKCGSSFCKDKSITTCVIKSLDMVRERGQQQVMVLPINTHPDFVDPLVIEWDDGMKTLVYKLGDDLRVTGNDKAHADPVIKHIFTCNLSTLQEEHTKLFEEMQADLVLERQLSDSRPYFTYAITDSPDTFTLASSFGAKVVAWHEVPPCITEVQELLVHVSRSYGETELSSVPGLLALAWTNDGKRKGDSLLEAQQTPIIVMNLGCNVIINLLPKSTGRAVPITLTSAPLPTPAPSPVKREAVDDLPLGLTHEIGGLLGFQSVSEEKTSLDADMQLVNDTLTSLEDVKPSQTQSRNVQKVEPLKFTLVHGDALILSGDDFEYTIERGGTSILLLGVMS